MMDRYHKIFGYQSTGILIAFVILEIYSSEIKEIFGITSDYWSTGLFITVLIVVFGWMAVWVRIETRD